MVVYSDVTGWVEALAANEELVSNVSHEFRTPLNSILGNVDLVLEDAAELSAITAQRLRWRNGMRNGCWPWSRTCLATASAALNVHPHRTDLASLVETSLGSARAQADRSGVCLAADVPSPLWAYADPLRIGQALDNLVSNAIKYSPDGGVVDISAGASGGLGAASRRDTGMGMTHGRRRQGLHAASSAADAAREAAIPGAGLGLSITKTIVERHGGHCVHQRSGARAAPSPVTLPAGRPAAVVLAPSSDGRQSRASAGPASVRRGPACSSSDG